MANVPCFTHEPLFDKLTDNNKYSTFTFVLHPTHLFESESLYSLKPSRFMWAKHPLGGVFQYCIIFFNGPTKTIADIHEAMYKYHETVNRACRAEYIKVDGSNLSIRGTNSIMENDVMFKEAGFIFSTLYEGDDDQKLMLTKKQFGGMEKFRSGVLDEEMNRLDNPPFPLEFYGSGENVRRFFNNPSRGTGMPKYFFDATIVKMKRLELRKAGNEHVKPVSYGRSGKVHYFALFGDKQVSLPEGMVKKLGALMLARYEDKRGVRHYLFVTVADVSSVLVSNAIHGWASEWDYAYSIHLQDPFPLDDGEDLGVYSYGVDSYQAPGFVATMFKECGLEDHIGTFTAKMFLEYRYEDGMPLRDMVSFCLENFLNFPEQVEALLLKADGEGMVADIMLAFKDTNKCYIASMKAECALAVTVRQSNEAKKAELIKSAQDLKEEWQKVREMRARLEVKEAELEAKKNERKRTTPCSPCVLDTP